MFSKIKNYTEFVNENLEDFYKDLDDSKKNIKLFVNFEGNELSYKDKEFNVTKPKKKFKPKVKVFNKKSDKGIF